MAPPSENEAVRPTRAGLDGLGIEIPAIDQPLHGIDDKHVKEMQKIPERVSAGGAERILKITDRIWFKYKSGTVRAAVGKLTEPEVQESVRLIAGLGRWWIGAAGLRQDDSSQHDFYESLPTSSEGLLPNEWDRDRLDAEVALRWTTEVRNVVRRLITLSLRSGNQETATVEDHHVRAQVTNRDEMYLTLGTGGIYDPRVIAVILDSIPRVTVDDWFVEPSGTLGIEPQSGEVLWSAVLPDETRQELLDDAPPES